MSGNKQGGNDWGTFLLAVIIIVLLCLMTWPPIWMF